MTTIYHDIYYFMIT